MPSVGVEYVFNKNNDIETLVGVEYQHVFPALTFSNDSRSTDAVKEVLKDTTINCINVYTGVNMKITPVISITGTTGIRLINATYDNSDIKLNLGLNSMYTQIGVLATL